MPAITALLHTHNDGLRVGRCLETLYPCDEILVVDHNSEDGTLRVAKEYGARILSAQKIASDRYGWLANAEWVLSLDPRESLTEALAASLFEWKLREVAEQKAFSLFLREETSEGWVAHPAPQTRLVPANWNQWEGRFPSPQSSAIALEGELLRFVLP